MKRLRLKADRDWSPLREKDVVPSGLNSKLSVFRLRMTDYCAGGAVGLDGVLEGLEGGVYGRICRSLILLLTPVP
jgi:hypothetical protein